MKSTTFVWKIAAVFVVAAILAGCTGGAQPSLEPTVDTRPTFAAIQTQAAETVIAQMTASAPSATPVLPTSTVTVTPLPSDTPTATVTNTPLPPLATATNTPVPWTATPYRTPTNADWNCTITEFSPVSTDKLPPGADFDGRWVVKNTGKQKWLASEVDIRFLGGTKFQKRGDLFDLKSDVGVGDSLTVIIDMLAPKDPGYYYSTWSIARGSQVICGLYLNIHVVSQ